MVLPRAGSCNSDQVTRFANEYNSGTEDMKINNHFVFEYKVYKNVL